MPDTKPHRTGPATQSDPQHVAVIMDGNGRWARGRGLPRIAGHEKGAESVVAAVRAAKELDVKYLTLYAFSVENWKRPKAEIEALMILLRRFVANREKDLHEQEVRLRTIGRTEDLPAAVQKDLRGVMERTRKYDRHQLVLALSYGGRTELAYAARRIAERVKEGAITLEEVDENMVAAHLYAPDIPDPDLMIRTSGEMRISNFLLWQLSYTELYVTDVLWPDFREKEFTEAVTRYRQRERRYGDIGQDE